MTHLIHVGNSLGVRIPKAIIEQLGFKKDTDLEFKVTDKGLLITPKRQHREGWEKAFKSAQRGKKEQLLMGEFDTQFDKDEWEWE